MSCACPCKCPSTEPALPLFRNQSRHLFSDVFIVTPLCILNELSLFTVQSRYWSLKMARIQRRFPLRLSRAEADPSIHQADRRSTLFSFPPPPPTRPSALPKPDSPSHFFLFFWGCWQFIHSPLEADFDNRLIKSIQAMVTFWNKRPIVFQFECECFFTWVKVCINLTNRKSSL